MVDAIAEEVATDLYHACDAGMVSRIVGRVVGERPQWLQADPDVHEAFRARAEQFMAGDERVISWRVRWLGAALP